MKLNKLLIFTFLTFVFIFSSCTESDDSTVNQEMNDDIENNDDDDDDSIIEAKEFIASGSGTSTITIADLCEYPFTSVTKGLELILNFENGKIISGTYNLDIKTETGNPVSADDVVCSFNPTTFDENHTGDLTISDDNISFSTNIGTSQNLINVTYTFTGSASETSYSGTVEHVSSSLDTPVTYNLSSELLLAK